MIYNATLLRLDPPGAGPSGPMVAVRCAVTAPSAEQGRISRDAGWDATAVAYLPLATLPSPRPAQEGVANFRIDGDAFESSFQIKQVLARNSPTLGHVLLYLAPMP